MTERSVGAEEYGHFIVAIFEEWVRRDVGRNEPCPCGSGEKYKRCHGSKTLAAPE